MKKLVCLVALCCSCLLLSGCSSEDSYSKCSESILHNIASSEENLLITHEATGVITGYAEYAGQYVVKVNKALWNSTTSEQRYLIRCSTETVAHKKGLKGVVLDPYKNEQLN